MHVGIEAYTSVYMYVPGCEACDIELQLDATKYRNIHVLYSVYSVCWNIELIFTYGYDLYNGKLEFPYKHSINTSIEI